MIFHGPEITAARILVIFSICCSLGIVAAAFEFSGIGFYMDPGWLRVVEISLLFIAGVSSGFIIGEEVTVRSFVRHFFIFF